MLSLTNSQLELDTDRQIGQFIREWRADDVRFGWGQLKPLWICREDGRLLRVYGRPGKVAVTRLPHRGQSRICLNFDVQIRCSTTNMNGLLTLNNRDYNRNSRNRFGYG